jgi:subtilisin family serine protease
MKVIYTISIFSLFVFGVFAPAFASDSYELTQGYQGFYNISRGKDVVIAVIDSGVWIDHPDLKQAIWTNPKEIAGNKKDDDKNGYIDDYNGWNFVDNNNKMDPKNDHGTSVAGIIAGQVGNNIGVAGIAPDSKIMPLIVCNAKECPKKAIIDAIKYAANNGAKIINLSLGSNGYVTYSAEYTAAIKYAYDKGVLVVASAGNGNIKATTQVGKDLSTSMVSPVCNESDVNMVVGVGSTAKSSYLKTNWSNYSDKYVDVWVRGDDLISTTMPSFSKGLSYNTIDGTSFSAPIVSGSAALLISTNPNL